MAIASRGKDDEDIGCCGDYIERPGNNVGGGGTSARADNKDEGGRSGDIERPGRDDDGGGGGGGGGSLSKGLSGWVIVIRVHLVLISRTDSNSEQQS
jgi:hypothetical protein